MQREIGVFRFDGPVGIGELIYMKYGGRRKMCDERRANKNRETIKEKYTLE
jgi:hypothetical protein